MTTLRTKRILALGCFGLTLSACVCLCGGLISTGAPPAVYARVVLVGAWGHAAPWVVADEGERILGEARPQNGRVGIERTALVGDWVLVDGLDAAHRGLLSPPTQRGTDTTYEWRHGGTVTRVRRPTNTAMTWSASAECLMGTAEEETVLGCVDEATQTLELSEIACLDVRASAGHSLLMARDEAVIVIPAGERDCVAVRLANGERSEPKCEPLPRDQCQSAFASHLRGLYPSLGAAADDILVYASTMRDGRGCLCGTGFRIDSPYRCLAVVPGSRAHDVPGERCDVSDAGHLIYESEGRLVRCKGARCGRCRNLESISHHYSGDLQGPFWDVARLNYVGDILIVDWAHSEMESSSECTDGLLDQSPLEFLFR